MDGKTARGASSPANPALHIPEPLSMTNADVSASSHIFLIWVYEPEKKKIITINQRSVALGDFRHELDARTLITIKRTL